MSERYWISNRHGSDWIDIKNRLVVDAAPKYRFALGWRLDQLEAYCQRRHWQLDGGAPQ